MSELRRWRSLGIWLGALVAGLALVVLGVPGPSPDAIGRAPEVSSAWGPSLQAMRTALESGDVRTANTAWLRAYGEAQRARSWEAFLAVGEASLALGTAPGSPIDARARARQLFLAALFRARDAQSLDGVLAASSAFAVLGDHEIVEQGIRMGRRLAGTDAVALDRVERFEEAMTVTFLARHAS